MPQPRCNFFARSTSAGSAPAPTCAASDELAALKAENEQLRAEMEQLRASKDAEIERLRAELVKLGGAPPVEITTAQDDAEETEARALVAREAAAGKCTFWFVSSAAILASNETTLPAFAVLRARKDVIMQQTLTRSEAYRAVRAGELCAVSHRWEAPDVPDGHGVQFAALRKYLKANETVKYVWYDYWCMPQDERTAAERRDGATRPDTRSAAERLLFKHSALM